MPLYFIQARNRAGDTADFHIEAIDPQQAGTQAYFRLTREHGKDCDHWWVVKTTPVTT